MCYIARRENEDVVALRLHRNLTRTTQSLVTVLQDQLAHSLDEASSTREKLEAQSVLQNTLNAALQTLVEREVNERQQVLQNFENSVTLVLQQLSNAGLQHQNDMLQQFSQIEDVLRSTEEVQLSLALITR